MIPDLEELDLDVQFHIRNFLTGPVYLNFRGGLWLELFISWPFSFDKSYLFFTSKSVRSAFLAFASSQDNTPGHDVTATRHLGYIDNCLTSLKTIKVEDIDASSFVALYYLTETILRQNDQFEICRVLPYFKALHLLLKGLRERSPSDATLLDQAWSQSLYRLIRCLLNFQRVTLEVVQWMSMSPEIISQPHSEIANLGILIYLLRLHTAEKLESVINPALLVSTIQQVTSRVSVLQVPPCVCFNRSLPPVCDDYSTHFEHRRTLFLILFAQLVSATLEVDSSASRYRARSAALGIWKLGQNYIAESRPQIMGATHFFIAGLILTRVSYPQGVISLSLIYL